MGHKSRKATQVNKQHKGEKKSTIGKKKTSGVKIRKVHANKDSKELRILKNDQRKKHSNKLVLESDYHNRGSNDSAPLLCGIFPLFEFDKCELMMSLFKTTDSNSVIQKIDSIDNYTKPNCERFIMKSKKFRKNFAFTFCKNFRDQFDYLDLAKVVDWCLFILPDDLDELIGDYTEELISALMGQGLPSSCFITLKHASEFKIKDECKYFEQITKIVLEDERIFCLNDQNSANKLMMHLSQNCGPSYGISKKSLVPAKAIHKKRGYFLIQNLQYNEGENQLKLTGCMRGFGIDLNESKYLHLTEVGDFPIQEIQWISPQESNRFPITKNNVYRFVVDHQNGNENTRVGEEFEENSEEEEDYSGEEEEEDSEDEEDEEMEEEVMDIGSVDSDLDPADEKMSFATTAHSGYSVAQIQKFKESRENSMFPDEIEVPYYEKAKDKLAKYRGLESFNSSEFPLFENLPDYYKGLHTFSNYQHARNRMCNYLNDIDRLTLENFVQPGSIFEMVLKNVAQSDYKKIADLLANHPHRHLIGSNLFEFEDRIGLLHFHEKRLANIDDSVVNTLAKLEPNNDSAVAFGEEAGSHLDNIDPNLVLKPAAEPIESKESMLFQIGFRRLIATPIYSEYSANAEETGNKGKGKFCRFMPLKDPVIASIYGPVTYGPVSVLQYRIRQTEEEYGELGAPFIGELVAKGGLISVDSNKPIIKRILLTGQIYKVHKRSVMVRYMFFHKDDIEHFKSVPLHTKSNKVGKIVSVHGTHGYMKCHFGKAVSQDEVVCMPLYKRVFPKFTVKNMYDHMMLKHEATETEVKDEDEEFWNKVDNGF